MPGVVSLREAGCAVWRRATDCLVTSRSLEPDGVPESESQRRVMGPFAVVL